MGKGYPSSVAGRQAEASTLGTGLQGQASGSGTGTGPGSDWLPSTTRVRNRALIAEAEYVNNVQLPVVVAFQRAAINENFYYEITTDECEYVRKICNYYENETLTQKFSKELGTMPADMCEHHQRHIKGKESQPADISEDLQRQRKEKEPWPADTSEILQRQTDMLEVLIHKHSVTISCLNNIMLLFNKREPTSMTSPRQFPDRLHKQKASEEFKKSLDELTMHMKSVQTRSEMDVWSQASQIDLLEHTYERKINNIIETFSNHIKNKCNCPQGVTKEIDTGWLEQNLDNVDSGGSVQLPKRPPIIKQYKRRNK